MATNWTTPRTWTAGELWTAAIGNTHIRDNLNCLRQPPSATAYNTVFISHATSGTWQAVTFDAEHHDTDALHSTSSNTSRLTVPTGAAGLYLMVGHVEFAANATGYRALAFRKNGATFLGSMQFNAGAATALNITVSVLRKLAASDYVELMAYQNSGGALNMVFSAEYTPEVGITWVGSG